MLEATNLQNQIDANTSAISTLKTSTLPSLADDYYVWEVETYLDNAVADTEAHLENNSTTSISFNNSSASNLYIWAGSDSVSDADFEAKNSGFTVTFDEAGLLTCEEANINYNYITNGVSMNSSYIFYSTTGSSDSTKTLHNNNASTITTYLQNLVGKVCCFVYYQNYNYYMVNSNTVYLITSSVSASVTSWNNLTISGITGYKYVPKVYGKPAGYSYSYLMSTDKSAYTESYANNVMTSYAGKLGEMNSIEIVRWTGTGTYGSSNPTVITFTRPVRIVRIYLLNTSYIQAIGSSSATNEGTPFIMQNITPGGSYSTTSSPYISSGAIYSKKSSDGRTLYFYDTSYASRQANSSGSSYMAVGFR